MMKTLNYSRYFIINLVIEGFYSWLLEKKQVARLSYVILEAKEDILNDGSYSFIYTGICFEGKFIKKLLSTENVSRLITSTDRSHIKISKCVPKSLTDEEILSIVKNEIKYNLIIPISTRSKLYSYNII